jgi:uncharacterized caspase-like protein
MRPLEIPLSRGRNVIRVVLTNDIGEKAETITMDLDQDQEGELDKAGALYIIAIGVDRYPGLGNTCGDGTGTCDLKFAGADAKRLTEVVEKRMGPGHSQIIKRLLVNGSQAADEPTVSNIMDALDLLKQAKATDTVVFYISGHSQNDGKALGFLSTTAERRGESFRSASIVPWTNIQEAVETAKGRRIAFIDTAISGSFSLRPGNSVVTYTGAAWNQFSLEDPSIGHGLFTYAVVEGLDGQALDATGKLVTSRGLADFINRRVESLARAMKSEQEPQYFSGADADADHVLLKWTWDVPVKKAIPDLPRPATR